MLNNVNSVNRQCKARCYLQLRWYFFVFFHLLISLLCADVFRSAPAAVCCQRYHFAASIWPIWDLFAKWSMCLFVCIYYLFEKWSMCLFVCIYYLFAKWSMCLFVCIYYLFAKWSMYLFVCIYHLDIWDGTVSVANIPTLLHPLDLLWPRFLQWGHLRQWWWWLWHQR